MYSKIGFSALEHKRRIASGLPKGEYKCPGKGTGI